MAGSQQKGPNAYLVIKQSGRWSDIFRLNPTQPLTIGRSSTCAIVVPDDRSSRQHAEISFAEGRWQVRDLGSRNGTLLDGETITKPEALRSGQTIQVAGCRVSFVEKLEEAIAEPVENTEASDEYSAQATEEFESRSTVTHRSELDAWSAELAFHIAGLTAWNSACEAALNELLKLLSIQAGGILGVQQDGEAVESSRLFIVSMRERDGKAYHRINEFLARSVIRDGRGVLARNIQNESALSDRQSSGIQSTTSVLCVPILSGTRTLGLVHLYTRDDEPMLTPKALDAASTAARMLAMVHEQSIRQRRIEKKLQATQKQVHRLQQELNDHRISFDMVGDSPAMKKLQTQIEKVAATSATILLRGPSGVGKELAARRIHELSSRRDNPFIAINCGALTATLLESELFGHEKGSFTGATDKKLGKFELADGGTLMLDEVGEMSAEIQVKFLRVLEGQPFERVGGSKPIQVDVRVVAATNRDLELAVQEGIFRSDLYYRLRVVELRVPSLAERRDDILQIAEFYLDAFRRKSGRGPTEFSDEAKQAMLRHPWPGNIRELRNCVERAHVLSSTQVAELEDLALAPFDGTDSLRASASAVGQSDKGYRERSLDEVEQEHIEATLEYTRGQKNRAANILGIERSTLDRKLKRFEGRS